MAGTSDAGLHVLSEMSLQRPERHPVNGAPPSLIMKSRTGESMMDSDLADTIEPDADVKALVGPFGARRDAGVVHERSHAECLGVAPLSPRHIDNVIAVITPTEAAWPTSYVGTTVHHLRLSSDPFGNPRTRGCLADAAGSVAKPVMRAMRPQVIATAAVRRSCIAAA